MKQWSDCDYFRTECHLGSFVSASRAPSQMRSANFHGSGWRRSISFGSYCRSTYFKWSDAQFCDDVPWGITHIGRFAEASKWFWEADFPGQGAQRNCPGESAFWHFCQVTQREQTGKFQYVDECSNWHRLYVPENSQFLIYTYNTYNTQTQLFFRKLN